MLGGFGASGGITGSKLGGSVVLSWGAGTKNRSFDAVEGVSDLALVLLEEGGDDAPDKLVLVDLRLIPHQQVVVDPVEVHHQELP
jgi:hypothetical protein